MQYVGQTYRSIRNRFQGHIHDAQSINLTKAVGEHFNMPDHNGWKDFQIAVLYVYNLNPGTPNNIGQAALDARISQEFHWQTQLKTMEPQGTGVERKKVWSSIRTT